MFELATILLSTSVTHLAVSVILFLLWRKNRFRGIDLWAWLYLFQSIGLFLVVMRATFPLAVSVVMGNIFIAGSMYLIPLGFSRLQNVTVPKAFSIIAGVSMTFMVITLYFLTFVNDNIQLRIFINGITQAIILLIGLVFISRQLPAENQRSLAYIKLVLLSIIVFTTTRAFMTLFQAGEITFPSSHDVTTVFLLLNLVLSVVLAVQFVLVNNEKLLDQVKAAGVELAKNEEKYRSVVENSPSGISIIDSDFHIVYSNAALATLLGRSIQEMEGTDFRKFVSKQDLERVASNHINRRNGVAGTPGVYEAAFVHADGSIRHFELRGSILELQSALRWTLVQVVDITERKRMQLHLEEYRTDLEKQVQERTRELIQAEKLSSLGNLSAGLAHEINNPNNYILLNSGVLRKGLGILSDNISRYTIPADIMVDSIALPAFIEEAPQIIDDIIEGSERVNTIVTSLKEYATPSHVHETELIDLNRAAERAVELAGKYIRARTIQFEFNQSETMLPILSKPGRIEHVLINLLQNSANALTIGTQKVSVNLWEREGMAYISITDEGRGIEPQDMDRLFDPFFTTRRKEGGTGLGLAIVHRIVSELGGSITVKSEVGGGSTFTVILPCAAKAGNLESTGNG
jgi:PAS domain S-box-containing protein